MSLFQSINREQSGQALVEFTLVLPVLIVLLFGMLDFGKAYNYWNDATHLTAEGVRFAAVNRKPDSSNAASLQAQIRSSADTAELRAGGTSTVGVAPQVCVDFPNGTSNVGDPVRVRMTFQYTFISVIAKAVSGGAVFTKTVNTTSVMRLEAPPTNYAAGCA